MPNQKTPGSRMIKAAGGVAWRPGPDGEPEVMLVHRTRYDDWSLPKGKTEPGEFLPVTAVREVLEEGGARLALGRRLVSVRYNVGGRPKRVHYWAARVLSVDSQAVPNEEVDEIAWVPASRAVDRVSYAHDHGVLADFTARPAGTVPLILLRHSKALSKHSWTRADTVRPLADNGRSDAKALADLLACFAPDLRLISSTALRCVETLRPLAQLSGEQVRQEPTLYIHNPPSGTEGADPSSYLSDLVREVIASGRPTVLCAHRENIPALRQAAVAALAGHPVPVPVGTVPAADGPGGDSALDVLPPVTDLPRDWDDSLATSGFWVLNIAPLPAEPGSAEPGEPGYAGPGSSAPASPAPESIAATDRRWWQRVRGRASGAAAASASPDSEAPPPAAAALDATTGESDAGGARHPVGILVSADRYDVSEP